MTKSQAAELVATLIAAFPHCQVSEATSAVYEEDLADLDFATAISACQRLRRSCRFLPSVADIRSIAFELQHGPVRPGGDAWGDVLDAIRRVGSYRPAPNFSDPIVAGIVERWGWRNLCLGEATSDRARFVELYDKLAASHRADQASGIPVGRQLTVSGFSMAKQLGQASVELEKQEEHAEPR